MKKIKKLVSLFAVALFCLMSFSNTVLTAYAAEPVTYYVKYLPEDDEWRFQIGSSWDENGYHRELYYLKLDIRDGDLLVVDGIGDLHLEVSAHLSNLTVFYANQVNITANGIDNCYVLRNSCAVINSDVTNAYVYGMTLCNFNKDVATLEILSDDGVHATVGCSGTVAHLKALNQDGEKPYQLYHFAPNTFSMVDGVLMTAASNYSTVPTATNADTPAVGTPADTTTSDNAVSAPAPDTAVDSNEYDDVPKTGDSFISTWLLSAAALCFLGSYLLKKEASNTSIRK